MTLSQLCQGKGLDFVRFGLQQDMTKLKIEKPKSKGHNLTPKWIETMRTQFAMFFKCRESLAPHLYMLKSRGRNVSIRGCIHHAMPPNTINQVVLVKSFSRYHPFIYNAPSDHVDHAIKVFATVRSRKQHHKT